MNEQRAPLEAASEQARRTWRLTVTLIATFGTLMVVGMLVVLGVTLLMATVNTATLLRDKADAAIDMLEVQIHDHLSPASDALVFLARRVDSGDLVLSDAKAVENALAGALAAAPQIMGFGYVRPDLTGVFVGRTPAGLRIGGFDFRNDPLVRESLPAMATATKPTWTAPVWRDVVVDTLLIARMPLRREGKFLGGIVALVRVRDLSRYLSQIGARTGSTPFIMYGPTQVLAHGNLISGFRGSTEKPLLTLGEVDDPVMAHLWDPKARRDAGLSARPPVRNHIVVVDGADHLVFYKSVTGFGPTPWLIGVHVEAVIFGTSMMRLAIAGGVGILVVILAIVAALLIGRKIARPIRRLADAAQMVGRFQLDDVAPLPRSGIREINDQSTAFNAMVHGLRWFGAYVPRSLVQHLVQTGGAEGIESDNRSLTVMFTDIAGFSSYAEGRPAAEVAEFLNGHFASVTRCIEDEGGTVDKFIGDSVMAFWGAPEKQKDRAARACRAALAIREAVERDNAERRKAGQEPARLRVGVHSGYATVGNIGGPDRLNYTVIGDMVNVAQRMEQLAKEVETSGGDVAILITEATRADLGGGFDLRSLGRYAVRGRDEQVEVFELMEMEGAPAGAAGVNISAPADRP